MSEGSFSGFYARMLGRFPRVSPPPPLVAAAVLLSAFAVLALVVMRSGSATEPELSARIVVPSVAEAVDAVSFEISRLGGGVSGVEVRSGPLRSSGEVSGTLDGSRLADLVRALSGPSGPGDLRSLSVHIPGSERETELVAEVQALQLTVSLLRGELESLLAAGAPDAAVADFSVRLAEAVESSDQARSDLSDHRLGSASVAVVVSVSPGGVSPLAAASVFAAALLALILLFRRPRSLTASRGIAPPPDL